MSNLIGMIVGINPAGIIGADGGIPWRYSADMKRFKAKTLNSTVVMGRVTYESIGKPLPQRNNIVVTSKEIPGVTCRPDIASALVAFPGDVWFIGGARIYEEAMEFADLIDITYVPDEFDPDQFQKVVYFPTIDTSVFEAGPREKNPDDPRIEHRTYRRRA